MDTKTYLEQSKRTATEVTLVDLKQVDEELGKKLISELLLLSQASFDADYMKRVLFYKEEVHKASTRCMMGSERIDELYEAPRENVSMSGKEDLLHAILGITSEAGELTEAMAKGLVLNTPIDSVNIVEELGDVLWYVAMALRSVNSSFEEAMEKNITKLKIRFPKKFSQEDAFNRDLQAEREVLEK